MPLDERIPSVSAAHTSGADQAMRHLLGARPPPHRRDHGPARLGRDRGPPARLPRGARRRGHPARPRARGRGRLRDHGGPGGGGHAARPPPTRRPRSSRSTTTSRSARCRRRGRAGLRVPEDLSVVGFDDVEHATIVTPDAHDRPPAAGRDGPHRGQPARPAAREPELRDAPVPARDAARRPRLDRAAAAARAPSDRLTLAASVSRALRGGTPSGQANRRTTWAS